MTRLQQILAAILVIQIALTAFVFWPQSSVPGGGAPLLPDFTAADVVSLTIEDGEGHRLVLARDGEAWILPEAGNYPADGEKIAPLLEQLGKVQTNRLVTETDASHKRLRVSPYDFNRAVEITLQDGTRHKIYLGNSAGAGATHVRASDQSQVYLTDAVQPYQVDPQASNWINTLYYTVPQTNTVAVTLENENGVFEFEREGETWGMKDLAETETFSENNFSTTLNQISSMYINTPLGKEQKPSFGLDNPVGKVTIKTGDGQTYTLVIGAQNEDRKNYVVKWSESPYYVEVAEFTVKNVLEKVHADFLEQPPEPESEIDSTGQGQ